MDYGILCMASVDSWKDVAFAETHRFTQAWIADSQMVWADPYQGLALCAVNTKTIKLGTNVTNPGSRIAPVTACSFATLNALAPGRAIMGIGTGNTSRRTLGMPPARLSDLRTHVEVCRGLWKDETVPYQEGERRRQIRFLRSEVESENRITLSEALRREPCRNKSRRHLALAAGLTHFGVNPLELAPGAWSSRRHWHPNADEFVYVLHSIVILVTDSSETVLKAGELAAFKAANSVGHHLQNRDVEPALILEVGTAGPTAMVTSRH